MVRQSIVWLMLCGILWILTGCGQKSSSEPEQVDLSFEEELVIGNDESAQEGSLLASPTEIRTDSEEKIYVSDRQTSDVKVFDRDGNYLHSIGGPGEGPGEFSNIPPFEINTQNELVAVGRGNGRITYFSDAGNILSNLIPKRENMVWPDYFRQIDQDRYLLLQKLRAIPDEGSLDKRLYSSFLHLFDSKFENRLSFGHIDSLMDASDEFVQLYTDAVNLGHFWPAGNGDIWFVPGIYDGRLFRYREKADGWTNTQTIGGHMIQEQPVEIDTDTDATTIIVTYGQDGGTFRGQVNSTSLGVFKLSNDNLIHFSSQLTDSARITMVEIFDHEGELEGVGSLQEFSSDETGTSSLIGSLWKDDNDRFYLIDRRDVPVVRIGRITGI